MYTGNYATIATTLIGSDVGIRLPTIGLPWWLTWAVGLFILVAVAVKVYLKILSDYFVVVPPSQVHIVVNRQGERSSCWSREGVEGDASYWYWPWWMTRQILPLEIIKMDIDNVQLHDVDFAPFIGDFRCWIVIEDPVLAAERLGDIYHEEDKHRDRRSDRTPHDIRESFKLVRNDVKDIIASVARYSSMNIELQKLMRDRQAFRKAIFESIDVSLEEWGLGLKDLEILHIKDDETHHVIADYEDMRAANIDMVSRTEVSLRNKEADIAESDNERLTRLQLAENEETASKREIAKDRELGMAQQKKELEIQKATQLANEQKVKAERTVTVGQAKYNAEATVETADGEKKATILDAEGEAAATVETGSADADVVKLTGLAEADANRAIGLAEGAVIKAKLMGEADGKDKLADALEKMQKSAMGPLIIEAAKDVQIQVAGKFADAIGLAKPTIISSSIMDVLGHDIDIGDLSKSIGVLTKAAEAFGIKIPGMGPSEDESDKTKTKTT